MTMTATEMTPAIGNVVTVQFESLQIDCKVIDVKHTWGKVKLEIEPLAGKGTQWIEMSRVRAVKTVNGYLNDGLKKLGI